MVTRPLNIQTSENAIEVESGKVRRQSRTVHHNQRRTYDLENRILFEKSREMEFTLGDIYMCV